MILNGQYILISLIIIMIIKLVTSSSSSSSLSSFLILPKNIHNNITTIKLPNKNLSIIDDHLCTREENYIEILRIPSNRTIRVRSSNWCLEIPPRCSNYRTEIREVIKLENVTKTRTIRFCCEGYTGIVSVNETVCRPICRSGCGRGICYSPDLCKCDSGYIGQHCTQRCPQDYWGDGCQMKCQCRNNGICDHKTGNCRCLSGWIGDMCHIPCPSGQYGAMCKIKCECDSQKCNPQTGECIYEKQNQRKLNLSQIRGTNKKSANDMIESLNSTIANLTKNLDKLTKNFESSSSSLQPIELFGIEYPTTNSYLLTLPEDNPTILIHESTLFDSQESHIELSANPEVIHVIDFNQQQLTANLKENSTKILHNNNHDYQQTDDLSSMILALIIFSIIISVILIGFVIVYRQHLKRYLNGSNGSDSSAIDCDNKNSQFNGGDNKFIKPLPDLPAFTQNLQKTENVPEFYDSPSNNSAVTTPYSYATASLYTTVSPKHYNRKDSQESHLYDEIRYPSVKSCRV